MSFILDALKKSEHERQRQVVPGLMDSRAARPRTRLPLWAVGLMLLLGFNLTVLTVVLTRGGLGAWHNGASATASRPDAAPAVAPQAPTPGASAPQGTAAQVPAPEPAAAAAAASARPDHFSPLDGPQAAAPVYAPEIPVPAGADSAEGAPPAVTKSRDAEPAPREARRRDPLLSAREDKRDDEVLPTMSEINPGGQEPLPALHLDVHVYATDPEDRFVYINMHKYREGSVLAEGPTVERIRRDGVVLDYHGLRFVLPRQQ